MAEKPDPVPTGEPPSDAVAAADTVNDTAADTAARRSRRTAILGAMFLMATSAIGPGFITQTTTFTVQLGAAFAFAILVSILVDIAVQLNVWRVVGVSGERAHELANQAVPGAGWVLTALVVFGGLVFNIGNIAGTGLGVQAMTDVDPLIGGVVTSALAIAIFLYKRAGAVMDRIVVVLGFLMIGLTAWIAITSRPPLGAVLKNAVLPDQVSFIVITTLIGGTVGGYITYAGAHRLLDSGTTGPENAGEITKSSILGVIVTGVMRIVLFLAVLGVVAAGHKLDPANPAADAFRIAAGQFGYRAFGVILWAAAITSVIGASYTSVSFLTKSTGSPKVRNWLTVGFIVLGTILYATLGRAPVQLLIFAGGLNGLILPIGFTAILWVAWRRRDLLHGYVYPRWLLTIGVLAWLLTLYLGFQSLAGLVQLWSA